MKLSLWNFKDFFLQENIDLTYHITNTDASITGLTLVASDQKIYDNTACVCEGILANRPNFRTVMFQGEDFLCFPTASPVTIINTGNRMIEYYSDWEADLYENILEKRNFSSILDNSSSVLQAPLALFSRETGFLYTTDNWASDVTVSDITDHVQKISLPELTPSFCSVGAKQISCLTAHFFSDDRQQYYLAAKESAKGFTPGIYNLFRELCLAIMSSLKISDYSNQTTREVLTEYLKEALKQSQLNPHRLHTLLKNAAWPQDQYFTLFSIMPAAGDNKTPKESLLHRFQDYFFYSVVFYLDQTLILITYSNLKAVPDIQKAVCRLVPDKTYFIGQSIPSSNLYNISAYYRQSTYALQTAAASGQPLVCAEDILPDILSSSAHDNHYLQTFLHPDLLTLNQYDRTGHDDLLETLYLYLIQGQNSNKTADALFIHRNTLRKRLNKINELIRSDLNSPDDTEQLLASFLIYSRSSSRK